jgi:hypothetical protein
MNRNHSFPLYIIYPGRVMFTAIASHLPMLFFLAKPPSIKPRRGFRARPGRY